MNIDFIKWMCEKAGWKIVSFIADALQLTVSYRSRKITVGSNSWKDVYYPLLLQRAIDGVNRSMPEWEIEQAKKAISVGFIPKLDEYNKKWKSSTRITEDSYPCDYGKESALKYIFEQDTK